MIKEEKVKLNQTKMLFMQNAPRFVVYGGFASLVAFVLMAIPILFTDERKFGLYAIGLCLSAICFLVWAVRRFERDFKCSMSDAMATNKKYWENHDK